MCPTPVGSLRSPGISLYNPATSWLVFDVVSLFTNVPTEETCLLVKGRLKQDLSLDDRTSLSPAQIHDLLLTCVSSSCLKFQGNFYEQTAGTSMGSPLSPVLADISMEEFETCPLRSADLRPSMWLRYVDDTFVVWPHGRDALQDFLQHLNEQHPSIKFTMEVEEDGKISFLDIGISRNADSSLHHNVYTGSPRTQISISTSAPSTMHL